MEDGTLVAIDGIISDAWEIECVEPSFLFSAVLLGVCLLTISEGIPVKVYSLVFFTVILSELDAQLPHVVDVFNYDHRVSLVRKEGRAEETLPNSVGARSVSREACIIRLVSHPQNGREFFYAFGKGWLIRVWTSLIVNLDGTVNQSHDANGWRQSQSTSSDSRLNEVGQRQLIDFNTMQHSYGAFSVATKNQVLAGLPGSKLISLSENVDQRVDGSVALHVELAIEEWILLSHFSERREECVSVA